MFLRVGESKNLKKFLPISGVSKHFCFCFPKKPKKSTPRRILFPLKSYIFCELKPHATFWNPTITPSGRKVTGAERRRRRKNAIDSGHLVP
jgi:hypothetical protein